MMTQIGGAADWWDAYPLPRPQAGSAYVRVNFISSADGAVTLDGRSGGLGGSTDRALMRILRAQCDVVLVGAGTVRAEGYGGLNLPADIMEQRRLLGFTRPPRIAVVSGSLDLTPDMSVFQKAEVRPLVLTHANAPVAAREALAPVADVVTCGDTQFDPALALQELAARDLARVLCEGGPSLFGALLEHDLVDEVCLTVSPMFVAGTDGRIARTLATHTRRFEVASATRDTDSFVFLRYARASHGVTDRLLGSIDALPAGSV